MSNENKLQKVSDFVKHLDFCCKQNDEIIQKRFNAGIQNEELREHWEKIRELNKKLQQQFQQKTAEERENMDLEELKKTREELDKFTKKFQLPPLPEKASSKEDKAGKIAKNVAKFVSIYTDPVSKRAAEKMNMFQVMLVNGVMSGILAIVGFFHEGLASKIKSAMKPQKEKAKARFEEAKIEVEEEIAKEKADAAAEKAKKAKKESEEQPEPVLSNDDNDNNNNNEMNVVPGYDDSCAKQPSLKKLAQEKEAQPGLFDQKVQSQSQNNRR